MVNGAFQEKFMETFGEPLYKDSMEEVNSE